MESQLWELLVSAGVPTAMAVIAVQYLWRAREKDNSDHKAEIKELTEKHAAEMKAERDGRLADAKEYQGKVEGWLTAILKTFDGMPEE